MTTTPAPLIVLFVVLLTACTDAPSAPAALQPPPGAPEGGVLVECRADVGAARMSCAPAAPAVGGASADMLLGGQNTYVHLYNDSITVGDGVFSTRVTVQNLTVQPMGTGDGTTVSPRGVRVFFHEGPSNGVEVANEDGVEMFTGPAQPYFQYDGILQPRQVSPGKRWRFALNGETGSFSFRVLLIAEVPSETGFLRMERVTGGIGYVASVWVDSVLVIAVGTRTLRSFDGGLQWTVQSEEALLDVWGERANVVAVGGAGRIRRSTDRGGTWQAVSSGTTRGLWAIWGHGAVVVAAGDAGTIVRSADGGATWQAVPSGTTQSLFDVWGHDSTFVAVGYGGTIVRSTDGGATWTRVNSGTTGSLYSVWGEGSTVLVGGATGVLDECSWYCGLLLRSADGGATWARWLIETDNDVMALWGSGSTVLAGMGPGGLDDNGEIFRSTDGGITWKEVSSLGYHQGNYAIGGSGSLVIALGWGGDGDAFTLLMRRSINQGISWTSMTPRAPLTNTGTWSDGRTIIVVGRSDYYSQILYSQDGGATWHGAYAGSNPAGVWGEGSTAVAVGRGGTIIRSADRGTTWATVHSGTTQWLRDVSGTGPTVVAVGDNGTIRRSTDGGVTWTGAASGTAHALAAVWVQGVVAVAVGASGTLLRSTDAGATWAPVASGTTRHLTGVWGAGSTMVAVGSGGHVQRSTDEGLSWTPVSSGTTAGFTDVSGAGPVVVATTGTSAILRSNDGGVTWHALHAGVHADLRSIWMANAASVIAAGDEGLILRGTR